MTWDNPAVVTAALKTWSGRVMVRFEPEEETRRLRANRFLFGVVYRAIAEETQQDVETIHEHCKALFNSEVRSVVSPATGEVLEQRINRTTTKLTVEAFHDFTEQVILWAAEFLGIVIDTAERDLQTRRKGTTI